MNCNLLQYTEIDQVNLHNYYQDIFLSVHVESVYKPLVSKYIKTIQNDNKLITSTPTQVLYTTKAASYFPRFHKSASKVFYDPYSSIIPYLFQNSPPCSKQFPLIKQKRPQLTTYVVKSPIEKNKII